jgi:tetratricopeptide (TPR) repeat protein
LPLILRQGVARISSVYFIGIWVGIQIFAGLQALKAGGAQVAYWGHIGGFLGGAAWGLATRQWKLGEEEFRIKEADHLFYKQQWYRAMENYKEVVENHPHCTEAHLKLALCWECLGQVNRAETVLAEALALYLEKGWTEGAELIQDELRQIVLQSASKQEETQPPTLVENRSPPNSNLMFRREMKWKAKKT